MDEIIDFLEKAEKAGQNIKTVIGPQTDIMKDEVEASPIHTVAFEARQLKLLFLKLHNT